MLSLAFSLDVGLSMLRVSSIGSMGSACYVGFNRFSQRFILFWSVLYWRLLQLFSFILTLTVMLELLGCDSEFAI